LSAIQPGTTVFISTADGQELTRRAVSEVVDGADFPVVWVTTEDEWKAAQSEGRPADALPWPSEDVRAAQFA
jgi:hypothetical protein